MNGFSSADMSTAAANGFRDGLAAQPAAAQEAAWGVYAKSDEYPEPILIPEYAGSIAVIQSRLMDKARSEGFIGDFEQRMNDLGWWLEPLFRAAPVAAAPVGDDGRPMVLVSQEFKAQAEYDAKISSDASNILRDNALGLTGSLPAMVGELLNLASTPAAPGIDVSKLADSWLEQAERVSVKSPDKAAGLWACANELRAQIDASPKG